MASNTTARAEFDEWLNKEAAKVNSKALSDERYDEIVEFLKNEGNVYAFDRNLRKRVVRNGYKLVNYPLFSLKDVLCIPSKEVNIIFISVYFVVANLINIDHNKWKG